MKAIIFLFLATFALTTALPPPLHDGQLHIPDKCEDVLAVKVCDNLEKIALRLKLNAEEVKKAVIDAVKQGKTSSEEIYNAAKDFLMKEVLTKKCEDFTTVENCQKLRQVAAVLKVNAAKVEEFVIKAVAEGAVQAKDIYAKALEYYKAEIATKKCEDFLSNSQCAQLRSLAAKLKINMADLEDAVKVAYLKTLGDAKAMYKEVIATLKDYALNTKCEDLLNPDLCAALRRYAALTKVQLPILMEKAVDLIISGYDVSKKLLTGIYNLVDKLYDCKDVFDDSSCKRLYKMASFLGLAHQQVEDFVKKYVPIVVAKGKDIINDFPGFMKELGKYLKDQWCKATPFCFSSQQQDEMMFSDDNQYLIDFDLIRQKIKEYIEIKYPGLQDKIKQQIFDLINRANSLSKLVQEAIKEIFFAGGDYGETIKTILKDLIANVKNIVFPQSDEMMFSDDNQYIDFDLIRQKIKEYIEIKYPGLQDKIKQQIFDLINRANSLSKLVQEAIKEIFFAGGDSAETIKTILKDLIANVKDIIFPKSDEMSYVANDVFDFDLIKQKIREYIEEKYPGLEDKIKQKIMEIVNKANSIPQLIVSAAKNILLIFGDSADKIKAILKDLVKELVILAQSDNNVVKRDVSFEDLKQKIIDFIEKKYPGLQEQLKQRVLDIVKRANSIYDIIIEGLKESANASQDYVQVLKKVWVDVFAILKN